MLSYHHVIQEIKIDSIKDLLWAFSPFGSCKDLLYGFIFRGESSAKYSLIPSALRKESQDKLWRMALMGTFYSSDDNLNQREWEVRQMAAEFGALREFFIRADNYGLELPSVDRLRKEHFVKINRLQYTFCSHDQEWIPGDLLELAGLAQHYGIPTRLLDWSHSHLIALYFAAIGALKNDSPEKKEKNDSDSMVLWALNAECVEHLQPTVSALPLELIKPPYAGNPNLAAQKGIFTSWKYSTNHPKSPEDVKPPEIVNRTPLDCLIYEWVKNKNLGHNLLYKFLIPTHKCHTLMDTLIKLGVDASKLFPGYKGISISIDEESKINRVKIDE